MVSIYGGRAAQIVDLAQSRAELQVILGSGNAVLAAEAVFAIREELAVTLIDIVHRRMMLGLNADQGASLAREIAGLAAGELHWSDAEMRKQLTQLEKYNRRLKPGFLGSSG
jgi:glycerol-3-phosphate dehydrogenase